MSTCFATFQAFERLVYIPIVLIAERWVTAGVGIAALASERASRPCRHLPRGALGALVLALYYLRVSPVRGSRCG